MHRINSPFTALLVATFFIASSADSAEQSSEQQRCINSLYKSGSKVTQAAGGELTGCVRAAGKGQLAPGQTADDCLTADSRGKVAKAAGKTEDIEAGSCELPPSIGPSSARLVNTAHGELMIPVADIFGPSLEDAIALSSDDRAAASCQSTVAKVVVKYARAVLKEYDGCVKSGLRDGSLASQSDMEACIGADSRGKIARAETKNAAAVAKKCGGVDIASAFPGECSGESAATLFDCIGTRLRCSLCTGAEAAGGVDADCDLHDDEIDNESCSLGGDWAAAADDYVPGETVFVSTLAIPAVVDQAPECCRDFGTISRDFIENGTNNPDNALALLDSSFGSLLGGFIDDALTAGDIVILADHQALDTASQPDTFALAMLLGGFDVGTDYASASAGTGEFLVNASSFVGGTGEPLSLFFPSEFSELDGMSAGPADFSLLLPFGALIEAPVNQVLITGAPTLGVDGITYVDGTLSGYILIDSLFSAVNAVLDDSGCDCLGLTESIYQQDEDGIWSASCVSNPEALCTQPEESVCATLSGTNFFADTPQVCATLPDFLNAAADLDLNNDVTRYEGFSLGLEFTAVPATITGVQ